jgi:hypothetical protein
VSSDGTGQLTTADPPLPEAGGANRSTRALHLAGSGFSQWGAGLSLDLRSRPAPYDAAVYTGIDFWARGTGTLHVKFVQANLSLGATCSSCDAQSAECSNFYTADVAMSDVWTQFRLDWSTLTHAFRGGTPFGADQLLSVAFESPPADSFDLWLDDVAFH